MTSIYSGRTASFATKHHKEIVVRPIFHEVLGLNINVVDLDTDVFGTFSAEVPRTQSPRATACAKARAGMELALTPDKGSTLGMASEGSIGPDPAMPFTTSDREIMVFIDDELGFELAESTRSADIIAARTVVSAGDDLTEFLERADFPRHGLIVHPADESHSQVIKGITDKDTLLAAIGECSSSGQVIIESDLRAQYSPTRMAVISACAHTLANRLATTCPTCAAPGWGRIEPIVGVPCRDCGFVVTTAIRAHQEGCVLCTEQRQLPGITDRLDPQWCPICNP